MDVWPRAVGSARTQGALRSARARRKLGAGSRMPDRHTRTTRLSGLTQAFSHISEPRPVALLSSFREWDEVRQTVYTHVPKWSSLLACVLVAHPNLLFICFARAFNQARGCAVPIEIADVGCGERHTAALLTSGNAFVWGWNESGQLGSGGSAGSHTPAMVSSTADIRLGRFDHLAVGPRSTAVF